MRSAGWLKCVHTCAFGWEWRGVHETAICWTLTPPRDKLGLHLLDILSRSGVKVDFTEAWRGIQRGSRTERKHVMTSAVTGAAFGQFRLLADLCIGNGEQRDFFMHHKCNIRWEYSSHTQRGPIRKNVLPFTRPERIYGVAERLHKHMHASLILFFFFFFSSSGVLRWNEQAGLRDASASSVFTLK